MTYPAPIGASTDWRDIPLLRVAGSAVSWFLFTLSFSLLFLVSIAVMSIGGSCASGGPYEIAVECPDNVTAFAPLSIFGGLLAVGISLFFARGFGTPLSTWAWPILFCGLGSAFLAAFIFGRDLTGLIIGGMFWIMGIIPLIIELRGSPQRVLLGTRTASGVRFYEGERARRSLMSPEAPNPEGAVPPTPVHWALSLGILIIAGYAGYAVAQLWFLAS